VIEHQFGVIVLSTHHGSVQLHDTEEIPCAVSNP
jgi:hypothetical protein